MSYTRFHYVLFSSLRGFPFERKKNHIGQDKGSLVVRWTGGLPLSWLMLQPNH